MDQALPLPASLSLPGLLANMSTWQWSHVTEPNLAHPLSIVYSILFYIYKKNIYIYIYIYPSLSLSLYPSFSSSLLSFLFLSCGCLASAFPATAGGAAACGMMPSMGTLPHATSIKGMCRKILKDGAVAPRSLRPKKDNKRR